MRHIIEVSQIIEFTDGRWEFIKYLHDLPVIPRETERFSTGWIAGAVTSIHHSVETLDNGEEILRTNLLLETTHFLHAPFSKEMVEENPRLKQSADLIKNKTSNSEIKRVYLGGEKPIFSEYY